MFSLHKNFLLFAFTGLALAPAQLIAADVKSLMGGAATQKACENSKTSKVDLPSQYLKEQWDTNHNDPCPKYDANNPGGKTCKALVKELEDNMQDWLAAHKAHCKLLSEESGCADAGQTGCSLEAKKKIDAAAATVKTEKDKVLASVHKIEALQQEMANSVSTIPPKQVPGQTPTPPVRGRAPSKLTANEIASLVQKIAQGSVTESDISRTKDPLVQEPLVVAEMMQEVKKQLNSRDTNLNTKSAELEKAGAKNVANAKGNDSLTTPGTKNGDGSTNTTGDLAKAASGLAAPAAGLAGAAGGGATGTGAGSSPTTPANNPYQYNNPYESGTGGGLQGDGGTYDPNGTNAKNVNLSKDGPNSAGGATANSKNGVVDITDQVAKLKGEGTEQTGSNGSSGRSRSSQSLKDSLRAKLAGGAGSAGGAAGTAASLGGGAGGGGSGDTAGAADHGVTAGLAKAPGSDDILANLGGGGGAGGSESFDLAGSETDAYVQSMVSSLSNDMGLDEHGREPASDQHEAEEGVSEEDEGSLFVRTKATLNRTIRRGNLITNFRSKL